MKTSKSIFAITAMAILATTVTIVSCKKDNENALSQKDQTIQQSIDYRQIEDKKAYFTDFRKRLTESKDNETYNLEDAAWHLACLANLDFCNVNVEYNNVQFDTVEMQVNVTNDIMLLGDIRTAYEQMCSEIQQFKKGFNHSDQNLYFINVSIDADGKAKIALMTSFNDNSKNLGDHTWYFDDEWAAYEVCDVYFTPDSTYTWNTTAKRELQRLLNLFEHYENYWSNGNYIMCYFPTQSHIFNYPNYPDPYGNWFEGNSRVFAGDVCVGAAIILSIDKMCYCLDSYLGLGYDYLEDYSLYENEHPVNWVIEADSVQSFGHRWPTYFHKLTVEYGQLIYNNPPGPNND